MRRIVSLFLFLSLISNLTGCGLVPTEEQPPDLVFETAFAVNADQEFHVSMSVRNAGDRPFDSDETFGGQMTLRDEAGNLRAKAEVATLKQLEPGETAWPLAWRGQLTPGAYQLTWGAEEYGTTTVSFEIVEQNGRLYLRSQEGLIELPPEEETGKPTTPTAPASEPTAPATYRSVEVPDIGLTFQVPSDWQQQASDWRWSPEPDADTGVGVNWMELTPPMEPEAAMLPSPSQILSSAPVELSWSQGRSFTLEVLGTAPQEEGEVKAPAEAVEKHVLFVLQRGGIRLGLEFFASAPTLERVNELDPALQHIMETAKLPQ